MSTQKLYLDPSHPSAHQLHLHQIDQTPLSGPFTPPTLPKEQLGPALVSEDQLINSLKRLMKVNVKNFCYQDAIFFADKIVHLTQTRGSNEKFIKAVYDLAHCYMLNKEHLRCVQLMEKSELVYHDEKFRLLTAQALFASGNLNACINVLEKDLIQENQMLQGGGNISVSYITENFASPQKEEYYRSLRYLYMAKCYEAQENKIFAVQFYKDALKINSENYEAFQRLISNHLITSPEKLHLLSELKFTPETLFLRDYYLSRIQQSLVSGGDVQAYVGLKQHQLNQHRMNNQSLQQQHNQENEGEHSGMSPSRWQQQLLLVEDSDETLRNPIMRGKEMSPNEEHQMMQQQQMNQQQQQQQQMVVAVQEVPIIELLTQSDSFDFKLIEAERLFNEQNYPKCYEVVKSIIEADFYYIQIVPLYCSVLIEMHKIGELYYLAHKLVSANAESAVAWFSVASYYFLIKKYDLARKYFNKANRIDKHFASSWIAFGHSFAAQDESDQAMAAYRTCFRLFPGCHLAPLYIGMEYLRTNNLKTALLSFNESRKIFDREPLTYNEMGVVSYKQKDYQSAEQYFALALSLCAEGNSRTYETVLINSAHCHRKLKDLDRAIEAYEQCLTLNPKNPSTYTSLGFAYHLNGQLQQALNCYHKANFLKNEDQLTEDLIQRALSDIGDYRIEDAYDINNRSDTGLMGAQSAIGNIAVI